MSKEPGVCDTCGGLLEGYLHQPSECAAAIKAELKEAKDE